MAQAIDIEDSNSRIRAELERLNVSPELLHAEAGEHGLMIYDENTGVLLTSHDIDILEHVVSQWVEATA